MTVKAVSLDLAKDIFQVHCVSTTGRRIINKKIKRAKLLSFFETLPRCVVGMEACGSSHHWGRKLRELGHDLRLMPAAYVKPYVKRGKTDAADAEAICEAVRRPTMRFVEIKSEDQKAVLAIHRARPRRPPAHSGCEYDPKYPSRVRAHITDGYRRCIEVCPRTRNRRTVRNARDRRRYSRGNVSSAEWPQCADRRTDQVD